MTYPFNSHIEKMQPYQPGKSFEETAREYGVQKIVKLASNENPLGPSPKVVEFIRNYDFDLGRYPDGAAYQCKEALASFLQVDKNQISLGNGSDTLFEAILKIAVSKEANENVVFSEYGFAAYPIACNGLNVPFKIAKSKNYGHDLSEMKKAIDANTRVVFIANPNNPTGTLLTKSEIEDFIESIPSTTYLVLDEAYYEYAKEYDYPESIKLLNKHPNLIITRTFSKAYGLAGMRFGFSISSEEISDRLNRVRLPFNVNSFAQTIAPIALKDQQHIDNTVTLNKNELQRWYDFLDGNNLEYIKSFCNFVTVQFPKSGIELYNLLLKRGVIARPLDPYQMDQHLRISIGNQEENNFAMEQLSELIRNNYE